MANLAPDGRAGGGSPHFTSWGVSSVCCVATALRASVWVADPVALFSCASAESPNATAAAATMPNPLEAFMSSPDYRRVVSPARRGTALTPPHTGGALLRQPCVPQRRLDELQTVVPPEAPLADEDGGNAEDAARERQVGVLAQVVL